MHSETRCQQRQLSSICQDSQQISLQLKTEEEKDQELWKQGLLQKNSTLGFISQKRVSQTTEEFSFVHSESSWIADQIPSDTRG